MSWLFIDTAHMGLCRFGMLGTKEIDVESHEVRSGSLLPLLAKKIGIVRLRRVDGICVVSGPGSFSSVRGGVLVANMMARLLRKPLVGVTVDEARALPALEARLRGGEYTPSTFVAPVYDAEPNITKPAAV